MHSHTTRPFHLRSVLTAAALTGTCLAVTVPAQAAEPESAAVASAPWVSPVSAPQDGLADAPPASAPVAAPTSDAPEPAPDVGQALMGEPASDPAQGGTLSDTGGTGDVALVVTGLTFVGLGAIAVVVTAGKRRKSEG